MRIWRTLLLPAWLVVWLGGCTVAPASLSGAAESSTTPVSLATPAAEPAGATPVLRASSVAFNDQPWLEARERETPTAPPEPTAHLNPGGQADAAPARLMIEAIALDQVVEPVGLDAQRMPIVPHHTVGWYTRSARPGQGDNVVLWGHVLRFRIAPTSPAPFARLHELTEGALISVIDVAGMVHRYTVTRQVIVTPDRVDYMLPKGSERLTLISCFGDLVMNDLEVDMTQRLITIAEPVP